MCGCNKNCTGCNGSSSADGTTAPSYDPVAIRNYINKYIFDSKGTDEELKEAYVKVMVWIEAKQLPFAENTISSNADELKVVINDPNFLEDKKTLRPGWKVAVLLGIIIFLLYWLGKR